MKHENKFIQLGAKLFGERAALEGFEGAFAKLQGGLPGKILLYPDGIK